MTTPTELEVLAELALTELPRVRPVLGKITDKWAVMILTVLCLKPARFNELKRRLEGITHKALADALKRLERNGLDAHGSGHRPGCGGVSRYAARPFTARTV